MLYWEKSINSFRDSLRARALTEETIRTRLEHLKHLARHIKKPALKIQTSDLIQFIANQKWAPETKRTRRTSYILFYEHLSKTGIATQNPAAKLERVKKVQTIARPTPETAYKQALKDADERTELILRLAAEHGLRRAEVAKAHTDDVIREMHGWSLIVHGKGRKPRIVPLNAHTAHLIQQRKGYLFPGKIDGHLSARWVGKLITKVLPDKWSMHTLRHRFATLAYQVDRDVFVVQDLLGHASPETTRRYCKVPDEAYRRTVEALVA